LCALVMARRPREVLTGRCGAGFALGLMAKDAHIARSVAAAAETVAPVIALADERWAKALRRFGPAARPVRRASGLAGRPLWGRIVTR
jgi:3-hydroxyisobutyrate dehydrogenase-like beta-hydroxyacid dehydrogenase